MSESVGTLARKGFAWSIFASGAGQVASVVGTILLARLLVPRDFGIYASTLIFTEVGSTLVSSGFVATLIQRRDVTPAEYSTTLVASMAVAAVLAGLLLMGSGWTAAFYHEPAVAPVLAILSISMIVLPFFSVPSAMLRKDLRFRVLAAVDILTGLVNMTTAIVLAYLHFGVWSLVWARVGANCFRAVFASVAAGWRPQWTFDASVLRRLIPNISLFSAKNILNDVAINVPYTLVGRLLGTEVLGFYSRADSLMALPLSKLAGPFGVVLFPVFAQLRVNMDELRQFLLKSLCSLSLMVFPAVTGLLLVADPFVPIVLGTAWSPVVAPLQILCLAGLIIALEPVVISALEATGYLKQEIARQILYLVLLVAGVSVGARFGTVGVAYAFLLVTAIHMSLLIGLTRRVLAIPVIQLWKAVKPALFYSAVMAICVRAADLALRERLGPASLWFLAALLVTGGVAYAIALLFLPPLTRDSDSLEVLEGVRARFRAAGARITGGRGSRIVASVPLHRGGRAPAAPVELVCPECGGPLAREPRVIACAACGRNWPVVDGIPHFIGESPYWGEISQSVMREILDDCARRPWKEVLRERPEDEVRRAYGMMTNLDRANFALLLPLPYESTVLDVGAGSGANAHGLALQYQRVVALEPVRERVELMQIRFAQESVRNIEVIRSGTTCLPFPPESFDLIVLNGVLEWIPWSDRAGTPREVQRRTLDRLRLLLRPGGWLYVGIENRLSLDYLLGANDPHANIPWVTVLPRWLADLYSHRKTGDQYRTHVYTYWGYRALLREAGFDTIKILQAVDSYNHPRFLVPCDRRIMHSFKQHVAGAAVSWKRDLLAKLIQPAGLEPYVGYSFAIFAQRAYDGNRVGVDPLRRHPQETP